MPLWAVESAKRHEVEFRSRGVSHILKLSSHDRHITRNPPRGYGLRPSPKSATSAWPVQMSSLLKRLRMYIYHVPTQIQILHGLLLPIESVIFERKHFHLR